MRHIIMNYPALDRFLKAQESSYRQAYAEIEAGRKRSHWIWYIFPQLAGLGFSENSKYFGIAGLAEAEIYLRHPVLGSRLISISNVLLELPTNNAHEVFGSPDDMKLKSCMTLFSLVPGSDGVFNKVLHKFFKAAKDEKTLRLLGM
jgi:uncharacterized protein (DUF1810 family)